MVWKIATATLGVACALLISSIVYGWPIRVAGKPAAVTFSGIPQVGVLFTSSRNPIHTCTATEVDSPAGNLVFTAAHCLSAHPSRLVFAPGFAGGAARHGKWAVTGAYVDPGWQARHDPHADFAFLTIGPRSENGHVESLQEAIGSGLPVALNLRAGTPVVVIGYPAGIGGNPIMCAANVYIRLSYPAFRCNGYVDGTSGGPWLAIDNEATIRPEIVGIIGGYEQGGRTPSVSYSPPFGPDVEVLYRCATHALPEDRCAEFRVD
jgi:V8-like Glu-specific endopeptidase